MSSKTTIKKQKKANPFAPTIEVKFHGRVGFGLNGDTNHLLDCLGRMHLVTYGGNLKLDFSDVDFFYPSGLHSVVIAGKILMKTRNCFISHVEPDDDDVYDFLSYSGFRKIVQGVELPALHDEAASTYKIRRFPFVDDQQIAALIDVIESELNISIGTRSRIHENIAELILNVNDHSESPFDCMIMGQAYPKSKRIRYCIGDAGIGIKEHLSRRHPEQKEQNTSKVIEFATGYGITGSFNNKNSGIGLNDLKTLVHTCGGSYFILSGNGAYEETVEVNYENGKENITNQHYELGFEFHGTFIDIMLQAHPLVKIFTKDEEIPSEFKLID